MELSEATVAIANKIAVGQIDSGIAAGVDTNSEVPIEFKKEFSDRLMKVNYAKTLGQRLKAFKGFWPSELAPKIPSIVEKRTGLSMGEGCEQMAKQWSIKREDQDELAYLSHKNAASAYDDKFMDDLVFEFKGVKKDTLLRADTSIEKLGKLCPAFLTNQIQEHLQRVTRRSRTEHLPCSYALKITPKKKASKSSHILRQDNQLQSIIQMVKAS